jgi:aspartate aminotransferase
MVSREIAENLKGGSMIRKMFEEGNRLRAIYGVDKVYDFSLGNPDGEPPEETLKAMKDLADQPDIHKYMPNAGYPEVSAAMAEAEAERSGIAVKGSNVVMTVGAAGGLNSVLKALLNPGDEVMILAPCFVEYTFYIKNHGGIPVVVPTVVDSFQPDAQAIPKQ